MGKRKRYLNKYNRMRSWTTPNRGVLSEYNGRIRSLAMDKPVPVTKNVMPLVNKFDGVEPMMVVPPKPKVFDQNGNPIPEPYDPAPPFIRVILKLFQSARQQGVEAFHYVKYPHTNYKDLMLFFSGNTYFWGYYGRDEQGAYVRCSLHFEGKPAAMRAYGNLQHYWIERIYINAD